jgi:glycosyltransferase involved in cell wall biosynthesis
MRVNDMRKAAGKALVWHLLSNRWNSAITEYALSAARALELVGYHSVFSPLIGSPAFERALSYGLDTRPLPHFGLSAFGQIKLLERSIIPKVVFVYGGPESVLVQLASLDAKIIRFRGQDGELEKAQKRFTQRLAHHRIARLITPSKTLAEKYRKILPTLSPQVVPLGRDRNVFHPTGDWISKPDRPELVVLGRLDPIKGHSQLFSMFAALLKVWPQERPRPLLHVIGQAANLKVSDIKEAAKQAELVWDHDVKLTASRVKSLAVILSRSTLGIVPSLGSEVICRVAYEFSLCGTPIFVSGVGALEEALFDGAGASYKGLSFDASVKLLADLILHAWEETSDQRRTRADVARQHYSLESMSKKLLRVVES